jgi:hypothetical protein
LRDALEAEWWPATIDPIRVRIGIHTGPAEARAGDYFGPTLNRTAAAIVIGYADSLFARMGIRPQPADEPDYIRIRESVEEKMGAPSYREATERGAELDLDEAVALVRHE